MVLARHGVDVRGVAFDSMLASYLLDADAVAARRAPTPRSSIWATRRVNEAERLGAGAKAVRASDVAPEALLTLRRRTGGSGAATVARAGAAARDREAWPP